MTLLAASLLLTAAAHAQTPACTYTFNPVSRAVPAVPDTIGQFTVTASASSCARTAVSSNPDWLSISFGATGTGNGTIGYRVDSNDTPVERTAAITIGTARFTVIQAARDCTFDLGATAARVGYQAGQATLRLTTQCRWTAVPSASWLHVAAPQSGSGSATIAYSYDENPSTEPRSATITAGGRQFALTQAGAPCVLKVSPGQAAYVAAGGSGALAVSSNCPWSAAASDAWISLSSPASASRDGTVNYKVAPNQKADTRSGSITVGDQTIAVTQAGNDGPAIYSVANAASLAPDLAAPGTIILVSGERFAGRLLIDGKPAFLMASSAEVITAVVPYASTGKKSVTVNFQSDDDKRSPEYTLPLAAVAPGLFTQAATGAGQVMAKNDDATDNAAANPAARGSTVTLYATGEGQTNPPGIDGAIPDGDPPKPLAPVEVVIGGAPAQLIRAAGAVGSPAGLLEVQVTIPEVEPGDAVTVELRIGGVSAQSGATIAVR